VEYVYYALVILSLVALCLFLLRLPGHARLTRKPAELADRARRRREKQRQKAGQAQPTPPRRPRIIQREIRNVPTPWGWPGSEIRQGGDLNGSAGARPGWIGRLVSEKRTVDDQAYQLRKDASLRALLEDRFGRPVQPAEMTYHKVRPPRLRDPGLPYDQQDNFPGGRTERIVAGLTRQPGQPGSAVSKTGPLENLKKPWGW
jgi:hypothetical protein